MVKPALAPLAISTETWIEETGVQVVYKSRNTHDGLLQGQDITLGGRALNINCRRVESQDLL